MKKILTANSGDAPVFSISSSLPLHPAATVPTGHTASRARALEAFRLKSPTPDGEKLIEGYLANLTVLVLTVSYFTNGTHQEVELQPCRLDPK